MDSVLGSGSGAPITDEFLREMKRRWFDRTISWSEAMRILAERGRPG
jgi:hypothetical protein